MATIDERLVPGPVPGDLGVYVHFPWCRHLCPYCDFPVAVARGEPPHDAYAAAILAELAERVDAVADRRLVSIYFGGGTPSLWRPDRLAAVVDAVTARFAARAPRLEITIEANPADCTPPLLAAWRAAGIDRVSIGVQSLDPRELVALGRDHRMGDGAAAIAAARAAGFASISADLILGVPGGTSPIELPPHVATIAASGVDHLSVYELTIEERTMFGKRARAGELVPLDEDTLASLYEATHHALAGHGFEHYEISSYARPGQRAIHNSLYWRGAEFLGVGTGAASFLRDPGGGGRRVTNVRSAPKYLAARGDERVAEVLTSDAAELADDLLWLGFRTSDGVAAGALADRPDLVEWLVRSDLATLVGDRVQPTLRGFLYADQVATRAVAR
ncbi:MAG: radical SAM family heme chaperone HemW [Deltaproteobacteria bacterium]|nr:radical SAM family heme chaperone HemW [Deltaproteobacteria bacterium]